MSGILHYAFVSTTGRWIKNELGPVSERPYQRNDITLGYTSILTLVMRVGDRNMAECCRIVPEYRDHLHESIDGLQGYWERLDQKVEFYQGYGALVRDE